MKRMFWGIVVMLFFGSTGAWAAQKTYVWTEGMRLWQKETRKSSFGTPP